MPLPFQLSVLMIHRQSCLDMQCAPASKPYHKKAIPGHSLTDVMQEHGWMCPSCRTPSL